ncbi:unnamed protein product [Cylicostephanus goldi]|uniref:Uncharacterized protein n=1 Tax=Cylicostephanus goldi TaxID=71465 RepID=A0A3P6TI41_CYLGO|nr:unnamed protein product [Cylicostephanus goldi]
MRALSSGVRGMTDAQLMTHTAGNDNYPLFSIVTSNVVKMVHLIDFLSLGEGRLQNLVSWPTFTAEGGSAFLQYLPPRDPNS